MSEEEIQVEINQVEENLLLYEDDSGMSNADAVSLFNTSLAKALKEQKEEIIQEFRKQEAQKQADNAEKSRGVSTSTGSTVSTQGQFEFKQEGTKLQYQFNAQRVDALLKIDSLLDSNSIVEIHATLKSEIEALNQRNKILKIADRHGWDTVHEYLDDPLADNVEDATKLRGAIIRATRKRQSAGYKPYNRPPAPVPTRGGFNPKAFFRGFSQATNQRNDFGYNQQQDNYARPVNDGLCYYCKRPGHTARICLFKPRPALGKPATISSTISQPQSQ